MREGTLGDLTRSDDRAKMTQGSAAPFATLVLGLATTSLGWSLDFWMPVVLIGSATVVAGTGALSISMRQALFPESPPIQEERTWLSTPDLESYREKMVDLTDLQAAPVAEELVGKWVFLEVKVRNVSSEGWVVGVLVGSESTSVSMSFRPSAATAIRRTKPRRHSRLRGPGGKLHEGATDPLQLRVRGTDGGGRKARRAPLPEARRRPDER